MNLLIRKVNPLHFRFGAATHCKKWGQVRRSHLSLLSRHVPTLYIFAMHECRERIGRGTGEREREQRSNYNMQNLVLSE